MKHIFGLTRDATAIWRSSLFAVRLAALVLASLAFAGTLYVTEPPGPGLQESSASYLGAAESAARGQGYRAPMAPWFSPDSTSPLTRYPPGYPVALTLPVLIGLPAAQAARLVQALSAFVAMAAVVAIVGDAAGAGVAVLLGLALLVAPPVVNAYLSVLSEPLFLACLALTLGAMVMIPEQPLAAGVCAAAAFLVRYTGISAVIAVALFGLMQRGVWRARVARAALGLAPAVIVAGVWLATMHAVGAAVARRLGMHPGLGDALAGGGRTLALWLVPTAHAVAWVVWVALPVAVGIVAVLTGGSRRAYRAWRLLPEGVLAQSSKVIPQLIKARVLGASALLAGAYALVLVGARLLADGGIAFDDRLVSPLVMLVSVAFAVSAASWWRVALRPWRVLLVVALAAWGIAAAAASWQRGHDALAYGSGLAADAWRRSATLEWARNDGVRYALYSNWPELGYLYLGRPVRGLPATDDPATLRAFVDTLAARHGAVLVFSTSNQRFKMADSLAASGSLRVIAAVPDGRVLAPPGR